MSNSSNRVAVVTPEELRDEIAAGVNEALQAALEGYSDVLDRLDGDLYVFKTWLSYREVAKYLGGNVNEDTVRRYVDQGYFPASKMGKYSYVRRSDVDAALDRIRKEQLAPAN